MIGIVGSEADPASQLICDQLLAETTWEEGVNGEGKHYRAEGMELRRFEEMHLELVHPERSFSRPPDLLVFASRHAGETGPLLTGHFTGNFGAAEVGGEPASLAPAAPAALDRLLAAFDRHAPSGYDTGIECTHHGPTAIDVPSLYAELGSDEAAWTDRTAATAVAKSILELRESPAHSDRCVVGIGGPHYAPRYERILRETPWVVGHICPEWALEDLRETPALVAAILDRSGAEHAILGTDATDLEGAVLEAGGSVVGERWLREVGEYPLDLVERIEADLGSVGTTVSLGQPAASYDLVDLPRDLIEAAEGIDREAVRTAFEEATVAFRSLEGGSRVGDRAAIGPAHSIEAIGAELAAVLEREYDSVTVEEDAVVADRRVFSPERAASLGVPEGPLFGRLAGGEPVEVEGNKIEPDAVHVKETRHFSLSSSGG